MSIPKRRKRVTFFWGTSTLEDTGKWVAFSAARRTEVARALNPSLQTFDKWLSQNTERIPLD